MSASASARALGLELPPHPSRLGPTITAVAVGLVVLLSVVGLPIDWSDVGAIPGELLHYGALMFADPNWEKLPRALDQ